LTRQSRVKEASCKPSFFENFHKMEEKLPKVTRILPKLTSILIFVEKYGKM